MELRLVNIQSEDTPKICVFLGATSLTVICILVIGLLLHQTEPKNSGSGIVIYQKVQHVTFHF